MRDIRNRPGIICGGLVVALVLFISVTAGICGSPVPLDQEAVFCIYHRLSREIPTDRDIEDLSFSLERPAFTFYKPAEMFTKKDLKNFRETLLQKIRGYSEHSVFEWRLGQIRNSRDLEPFEQDDPGVEGTLPAPTPFIRGEMTGKGREALRRAISRAAGKAKSSSRITVHLKAEGITRNPQKRLIAGEEVLLPIRTVVFRPVKISVTP